MVDNSMYKTVQSKQGGWTNFHSYFAACHVILERFCSFTDVLHMTVPHQRN